MKPIYNRRFKTILQVFTRISAQCREASTTQTENWRDVDPTKAACSQDEQPDSIIQAYRQIAIALRVQNQLVGQTAQLQTLRELLPRLITRKEDTKMSQLIDICGVATLGTIGAIAILAASALNPIGAGLVIAGVILWAKQSR